jgi:hypothetical protein
MTAPASDAKVLVQAVQDNAQRLGLTWQLQFATVADGTVPAAAVVTLDSDALSVPAQAVSLVGAIPAGERVAVMSVPPDGMYVIGRPNAPVEDPVVYIDGASTVTSAGGITTEVAILTITNFLFEAGRAYKFEIRTDVTSSNATNNALWRIRRSSVGGAVLGAGVWALRSAVGGSNDWGSDMVVRNTTASDVTDNAVFTLERSGVGTITMNAGATQVCWLRGYRLGDASRFANAITV